VGTVSRSSFFRRLTVIRANVLLRDALYGLRESLGDDVIVVAKRI
jgi:hypothetical protein